MKRAWLIPLALAACSSDPEDSLPDAAILDAQPGDAQMTDAQMIDAGVENDGGMIDAGTDCVATMPSTMLYQDYCEIGRLEMCLYDELRGPR